MNCRLIFSISWLNTASYIINNEKLPRYGKSHSEFPFEVKSGWFLIFFGNPKSLLFSSLTSNTNLRKNIFRLQNWFINSYANFTILLQNCLKTCGEKWNMCFYLAKLKSCEIICDFVFFGRVFWYFDAFLFIRLFKFI